MKPFTHKNLAVLPILLALAACGSMGESQTQKPSPTPVQSEPGVVQGVALDTQGRPLVGVKIWVRPSVTTGLLQATTDAQGRYRVKGPSNIPYNAYAYHSITYRGKQVCFRLGAENPADYDSFVPERGVVRNFKWQMSGAIPDNTGGFFGGEVRVFVPGTPEGSKLELTLTPDGPLADGSTGKTLRFTISEVVLKDIPVGVYKATAAFVDAGGARTALEVSADDRAYSPQANLQWHNESSCVGSTGGGTERAFLWLRERQ
jgi:hypothetical protein